MSRMVEISDFARYIGLSMLSKGLLVTPLKLQKILYYQQAWFMVFYGRDNVLFDCAPEAWVNGPVYPKIYHQYKSRVPGMCDKLTEEHFGVKRDNILSEIESLAKDMSLTASEIQLIDSVLMIYGSKSENQLILVSHSEKPWCEARGNLLPFQSSDNPISLDTMYSYYKERHDRRAGKA